MGQRDWRKRSFWRQWASDRWQESAIPWLLLDCHLDTRNPRGQKSGRRLVATQYGTRTKSIPLVLDLTNRCFGDIDGNTGNRIWPLHVPGRATDDGVWPDPVAVERAWGER